MTISPISAIARRFSSETRAVGARVTTSSLFLPSGKRPLQEATVQSHKVLTGHHGSRAANFANEVIMPVIKTVSHKLYLCSRQKIKGIHDVYVVMSL